MATCDVYANLNPLKHYVEGPVWTPISITAVSSNQEGKSVHLPFLCNQATGQVVNGDSHWEIRSKCFGLVIGSPLIYMIGRPLYFIAMMIRDLAIAFFKTLASLVCYLPGASVKNAWVAVGCDFVESVRSLSYGIIMTLEAVYGIFMPREGRELYSHTAEVLNRTLHREYHPQWKEYLPSPLFYRVRFLAPCFRPLENYKFPEERSSLNQTICREANGILGRRLITASKTSDLAEDNRIKIGTIKEEDFQTFEPRSPQ